MDGKVKVISNIDGTVGVFLPNLNFSREWLVRNQVVFFPKEIMEEAMYDPGFNNMIKEGILYIDDLEAAKELGLEDQDAEKPTLYKHYTEIELKKLIKSECSIEEFKEAVDNMPSEQRRELADWAITLRLRDSEKIAHLRSYVNVDIDKGIYLDKISQEG